MNYLAHLYLSGEDDGVKIGNYMGDYVKGRDYEKYSDMIKKGILLHRGIDNFTDKHSIVRSTKTIFQKKFQKYSGIIVDILFDHLLYKNWEQYSQHHINDFVRGIYGLLRDNIDLLPPSVQRIVPSFIEKDWINAYRTLDGIELVLNRMAVHTTLPDNARSAIKLIKENYKKFDKDFNTYFPMLIKFVEEDFEINILKP